MKVSVIVCTKGRYEDLIECLSHIKKQEFDDYEVVIVDGDGDPTVLSLAKSFGFVYVDQKKTGSKMNTPSARNLGIKNSSGDIVAFIDDDAVPTSGWLSSMYSCYLEKKAAAVGGPVIPKENSKRISLNMYKNCFVRAVFCVLLNENTLELGRVFPSGLVTENWDTIKSGTWSVQTLVGTNMSFHRSWLRKVGYFDEFIDTCGVRDETDICVRIIKSSGQIFYTSDAMVYHKLSPKSESKMRLYFTYFTDFYFLFKHKDFFSMPNLIVREVLLLGYLLLKSCSSVVKRNVWKYAVRGRIDAYLSVRALSRRFKRQEKKGQNQLYCSANCASSCDTFNERGLLL